MIVEPVAGNMNSCCPRAGFLAALRELCTRHGALLIFDEVMTGFRVALGGAQALYGITPGPHHARQGDRRRPAGRRLRRPARHHAEARAARPGLPGRHAVGQSGGGGRRPRDAQAGAGAGFLSSDSKRPRATLVEGLDAKREKANVAFSAQSIGSMFGDVLPRASAAGELRRGHAVRQGAPRVFRSASSTSRRGYAFPRDGAASSSPSRSPASANGAVHLDPARRLRELALRPRAARARTKRDAARRSARRRKRPAPRARSMTRAPAT